MVVSMTGYGRGEAKDARLGVSVEVKSVNHRFFEPVINLPLKFWELEGRLKERLRTAIRRGHVDCNLYLLQPVPGTREPIVDADLAARYVAALRSAGARLGLAGEPDLEWVARLPEVLRVEERPVRSERLAQLAERALARALVRLQAMRRAEGVRLAADIRQRLALIRRHAAEIQKALRAKHRLQKERVLQNAQRNGRVESPEGKRAVQENVVQSLRADVTEEIVRLNSHLVQFAAFLRSREAVGRRLDFLLQEMNREANTLGSKAGDVSVVHRVVAVKEELEKIREQVQNLE